MKVALVATHPIQYQVPWYRALARRPGIELTVYFALLPDERQQGKGFEVPFRWDLPLLTGYEWEALPNRARSPGLDGFFASSSPGIFRVLKAARPDAVVLTGWHARPLLQTLGACIRHGIPRIVRGESNALRRRPLRVRALHRMLLPRYDAFLAVGRGNREFYLRNGVPAERIFPSPYVVDNERFTRQAAALRPDRDAIRAEWSIPEGSACFLFAGKLEPKKRILDLLDALELAAAGERPMHLLVVGTGELMEPARRLAAERGLPVTFAGFLNQTAIARAYVAADCLVLPSDYGETWGLVVNEAMACGLPALVSDRVGCGPDLVRPGRSGDVFPCGDVPALAGKLAALAGDPAALRRMGDRARTHVLTHHSVDRAVDGTVAALDAVVRERA